jgi:glycosyltransferase involved in cell wall biosynthesis
LLSSTDPELRLTIAGDGNLRSKVEKKIRKFGLESCVEVLGAVPHERVPVLMQKADLYAQHGVTARGGDQEGLGLSLIEASATGLPIVSTHLGGIPEVVAHGETGLLVQERDVEGMGRCIAELVRAPERRRAMGRTARRCVEEHFDLKTQMRNLTGLYEEVLA